MSGGLPEFNLPEIELLEKTHQFPCAYVFKAIGVNEEQFIGRVVSAVRAEIDVQMEPPFSSRTTRGGRHVCVTIQPEMQSAEHVITVYESLRQLDGLVMLL